MATRLMSKWTFDGEEYEIKDANARSRITTVENNMVTSVEGKGLSTNDFTNEYKSKVDTTSTNLNSHISNTSNPHSVTASQVGLGNVTNNKQIKGLSTGTTSGNVVTWGADGYSVQDSGFTIKKSVPSDAVFTDTVYTHPTISAGESTATATLTHGGTFKALGAVTVNTNGHVTGYTTKTFTLPSETSLSLETSGTGNVITGVAVSGHKVTVTKGNVSGADHTHSNYENQNAFSNVVIGDTTVAADSTTDTLTLVAGSNITLTPDATNDKITIAATDTVYTHPTYTAKTSGLYKVAVDSTGHVSGTTAVSKSDITALGIPAQDTTYSAATTSAAGLLSASDKTKLDGIAAGAQVNTVTGVKGSAESSYRTGNINITAANIGLGNVTNESKTTMFTSAALTGTPTAPTPASSTNSTQIATTAFVHSLVGSKIAAADAMIYKGTIGSTGATITALPATHTTGWTYKVITAGTYAGVACEVGDMIICLADGTTASDADWSVVQTNIDGAVTGPSSAVAERIAVFNGTTGKVIKDSGYTIATSVPANAKFTDTTYSAATTSAAGLMSASDKTKLNNIASGAQVNQNAFSNVVVGSTTVAADNTTDTLTLVAGSNVTLTPDATNDKITIAATDTVYTHPTYTAKSSGLYKVTVDSTGHVSATTAVTKADITALGIPGSDTNTDTKVTQTVTTSDASYPLLLAPSGQTATTTGTSYFDSGVTLNPSTNTIVANISGNAATATKATQDSAGQQINTTYIKGISASGKTITYTKGDGTTGTITTQDTTYSAATTSAAGLLSASDKTKLDGIAAGAQVNQNAFSNVKVGTTTIAADSTTDTLTLVAGSNVTLTPDATGDSVTIAATDTVYTHPTYTGDKTPDTVSPTHGGEFDVVSGLTLANGHVSGYTVDTVTLPAETTLSKSESGTGNAITAIAVSGHTVTVTKGKTFSESTHTHNYAGSSSAGGAASKAISDNNGKAITSYISGLSASGKTITYTKGDGTTGTITTQDTTYSDMVGATSSAAGTHGLVPAPAAGKQTSFLRGDGTWATPYTHPSYTAQSSGLYKVTVDSTGHISSATAVTKDDIVNLGIPSVDTTYTLPAATASTLGGVKIGSNITVSSGVISLSKSNVTSALGYTPPTSDTHYTTGLKVGASNTATANAAASNGSVYLNALDNTTVRDSHLIKGTGATTVTSDANGVITINSTNTVYTHPTISATGTTSSPSAIANGGTFTAIDSVTVNSNGHVTGYNLKTVTLPTITAASLGLGNAMHFRGTTTDAITDGATTPTSVKLDGATTASTVSAGDVVLYGGLEFIWTGSKWQKLGDETSFALKSNTISSLSVSGKTITYTKADGTTGNITTQDTVYTHPSYTAKASGLYKVTVDATGHVSAATAVTKSDITALGIPSENTDTKVTQTVTTTNASYPLLLAPSGQTATTTGVSYFDSGVTLNPSTNTIAANISGNAATATKLATARNFRIRTGAHSVTTTFDGSSDIQMDIDSLYEAYLAWGGQNLKGTFGPLDAALIPKLGANRFGFMPADAITVEYSTDGGTTWVDYGSSDGTKISLVSGIGASLRIGKDETTSTNDKSNYMVRVTIDAVVGKLYTILEKIAILVSTDGSTGSYCTIEGQTRQNYADGVDTWKTLVDQQSIKGWSGWNIINNQIMISSSSGSESTRYGAIRFTFGVTSHESTVAYAGLRVLEIMGFGGVGWVTPSTMAKTGNIYSYDSLGNVTFPAAVVASQFSGPTATTSVKGLMGTTQVSQLNAVYNSTTTMAGVATMLNLLVSSSTAIDDSTTYISMASSNQFRTRPHSMLWTYIKGKADSVYQPIGNYLTGITKSDVTTALGYTPPSSNTDTLMTQTANTGSTALPILIGSTASPSGAATGAYVAGVTITPSTKTITATTFSGNATSATKATQDSAGQQINTTYIKALSISGKTITYTKGNGTTGTITTQDTVYTHPSYTAKSSGLYKVTVDATGHVSATTAVTKSDITALGIPAQDTTYTHPSYTAKSSGLYKVTVDSTGHVSATTAVTKSDITALGIPAQDTTYTLPNATSSVLGGVKIGSNITVSSGTISLSKSNVTSALGYTPTSSDDVKSLISAEVTPTTVIYNTSDLTSNEALVELITQIQSYAGTHNIMLYETEGANSNHFYRLVDYDSESATFSFNNTSMNYVIYMDLYSDAPEFYATRMLTSTKTAIVNALGYTPPQKLTFTDLTVATSDWEEDETYPDFPYKAAIACTGVTAEYLAQVIFNVDEVISGIYAPVNETGDGTVSVWASELPEADIVIPTISCLL